MGVKNSPLHDNVADDADTWVGRSGLAEEAFCVLEHSEKKIVL